MPKEEIITALRNAVEHGEELQTAVQVLINSGYNARDVRDASQFVGGGVIANLNVRPEEELVMPNKNGIFSRVKSVPPIPKDKGIIEKEVISSSGRINKKRGKGFWFKEIVLLAVLLLLVGVLILTIIFRKGILNWFGG